MPGGCIVVHKSTPDLQYTPGSGGKGVANAPSGRTHAMASCMSLFYTIATMLQAVDVVEKIFRGEVARHLKVDTKKIR